MRLRRGLTGAATTLLVLTAFAGSALADAPVAKSKPKKITVTSSTFANDKPIPAAYTCDGVETSPSLKYTKVPKSAKDLALIMIDPDAPRGTFVHWVAWHLPKGELPEQNLPSQVVQGTNTFGEQAYGGPCPPQGSAPHHYVFTVYGVSKPIDLAPGASADDLRAAIKGNIVGQGKVVGTYQRA